MSGANNAFYAAPLFSTAHSYKYHPLPLCPPTHILQFTPIITTPIITTPSPSVPPHIILQFTAALRSFRPSATVLEAEIAGIKSTHSLVGGGQHLDVSQKSTNDVMQRKRAAHASVIDKERRKHQQQVQASIEGF